MLGEEIEETPEGYQGVLASDNKAAASEWLQAMKNEAENLSENRTFERLAWEFYSLKTTCG